MEDAAVAAPVTIGEEAVGDGVSELSRPSLEIDDKPVSESRAFVGGTEDQSEQHVKRGVSPEQTGWFYQNRENLLLGILVLYVLLLGLGTAGELFEIEWVLNLPIFK